MGPCILRGLYPEGQMRDRSDRSKWTGTTLATNIPLGNNLKGANETGRSRIENHKKLKKLRKNERGAHANPVVCTLKGTSVTGQTDRGEHGLTCHPSLRNKT